ALSDFQPTPPVTQPPSLSYHAPLGRDFLELGLPVLADGRTSQRDVLLGGVRVVTDTRSTAKLLAKLQGKIAVIAACVVLFAIPVGQLLVWRVLGVPIRKLVQATRRLADGDFSARTETRRNDEIGELAHSFDTMAESLAVSRQQLRNANDSLEQKVRERTAELATTNGRLRAEMVEKEDFLRAVSHDLNAPLRNIAGMATMIAIKHRESLPEEVADRLQRIQANVDVGSDLLEELLDLSRVKTSPQKRRPVDVGTMLEEMKGAFEFDLKRKGIALTIRRPMPTLVVERNRIRQLFQNLMDNAIKYIGNRTDGRIDIGYEFIDGMHRFHVADNGPGIIPAEQERIFYVFR
ncbi:hypothetical protein LCGC14_3081440, partial [marine sediment metagenome]